MDVAAPAPPPVAQTPVAPVAQAPVAQAPSPASFAVGERVEARYENEWYPAIVDEVLEDGYEVEWVQEPEVFHRLDLEDVRSPRAARSPDPPPGIDLNHPRVAEIRAMLAQERAAAASDEAPAAPVAPVAQAPVAPVVQAPVAQAQAPASPGVVATPRAPAEVVVWDFSSKVYTAEAKFTSDLKYHLVIGHVPDNPEEDTITMLDRMNEAHLLTVVVQTPDEEFALIGSGPKIAAAIRSGRFYPALEGERVFIETVKSDDRCPN